MLQNYLVSLHHLQEAYMLYSLIYEYLLTSWNRVLEKLSGLQLVRKFHEFYGTQSFITAFTNDRYLSLT
jgi:hypothetical protein